MLKLCALSLLTLLAIGCGRGARQTAGGTTTASQHEIQGGTLPEAPPGTPPEAPPAPPTTPPTTPPAE